MDSEEQLVWKLFDFCRSSHGGNVEGMGIAVHKVDVCTVAYMVSK